MLASLLFLLFCLSDWLLLTMLPHLRLSFAPSTSLVLMASLVVRAAVFAALSGAILLARRRRQTVSGTRLGRPAVVLFLLINLGFSAVQVDAYVVEPLLLETTQLSLVFDELDPASPPVRLVHLTDLHLERRGVREARVIRAVNDLRPDLIVLTGDYLNLSYLGDPVAAGQFRELIAQLDAPFGIYAVRGTVEPIPEAMAWLIRDTGIVWLEQEAIALNVRGQSLTLAGVACSHVQEWDAEHLRQTLDGIPATDFTVLLYHSPDLILEAAEAEVDLFLAGHTHGGQIRLPFLGPIVTYSRYGSRYAAGLFQEGDTTMHVSRGLGFEGSWLPRARFLCPPEIVSFELAAAVP
ncbi:MAG: metallophosphoesterase [Anaerolineae bacterium]